MVITSKLYEISYENPGSVELKTACYEGSSEYEAIANFKKDHPLSIVKDSVFRECKGTSHTTVTKYEDLTKLLCINYCPLNIFIGPDCSGKDYLIDKCSEILQCGLFKPNYKDWTSGDIKDRWMYFQYALRLLSSMDILDSKPILIDRSSLCGAIYNNELSIALEYGQLLKSISSLHILVVPATTQDFDKFVQSRLLKDPLDQVPSWERVNILYRRYKKTLDFLQLPYIVYKNSYSKEVTK